MGTGMGTGTKNESDTSNISGAFAFVIMPFSDEMQPVYDDAIKKACTVLGMTCNRVDEQIFNEAIVEHIYDQIRRADLIIAELSEPNPNVYYELGFARALGKKVVLLTDSSSKIPFDLQAYQHLVYQDRFDLLEKLPDFLVGCYEDDSPFDQIVAAFESSADAQGRIAEYIKQARKSLHLVGNNFHIVLNDRRALLIEALERDLEVTFVLPPLDGESIRMASRVFGIAYNSLRSQCSHGMDSLRELEAQAEAKGLGEKLFLRAFDEPPEFRAYGFDINDSRGRLLLVPYFNFVRSSHCPTYEVAVAGVVGRKYRDSILECVANSEVMAKSRPQA